MEQNNPNRPPKILNDHPLRKRLSISKPLLSKSRSRLVELEPWYPIGEAFRERSLKEVESRPPFRNSPKASPLVEGKQDEEVDKDIYKTIILQAKHKSYQKLKVLGSVEWMIFIVLIGAVVASLTIRPLEDIWIWSLELWKWCFLVLVVISGQLVTKWFMNIFVYLVERNFLLRKKVLYFIYGLKRSIQIFLWLMSILVAWILFFDRSRGSNRSDKSNEVLQHMTMAIAGCVVGAGIWMLKTLLIKIVALSFHVKRFFDRIQVSIFYQYVLQTLSGPPLVEMEGETLTKPRNELSFESMTKGKGVKEEVINVEKLHKISQEQVSAWTMRGLVNVIRRSKLSTVSSNLDSSQDYETGEHSKQITSEWEAKTAADKIFMNVAKPDHKYIDEEDLLRFMRLDEVHEVFHSFEGAVDTGKITKLALRKWVVNAYLERKSLAHSLNDTKTAVKQLNSIASGVIWVIDAIVWNLMMGFVTTKVLVFITSQLVLVAFVVGDTVKGVFEAIIFVFMMHPFDVGDRCVIDGVQMTVEEMNILNTVFLRYDNEKIFYPNSVLSTKPISNFYRSPEMSEAVEFAVDFSTTVETIAILKARIKGYIESKPYHWRSIHSVHVKDFLNMNTMTMSLHVNHTINFQDNMERSSRRSDLVLELKKIFEDLGIRYHLLPQEVQVTFVGSPPSTSAIPQFR
ncbi:mechanosensitive ion channel protein 10-like isoform X2 [Silene latifolia]